MPDETRYVAAIGPLYNVPLVVVAVAFTAIAWFNGLEMLIVTWMTFKKRSAYFYSLIVCCFGILCYETSIFCLIFVKGANTYGTNVGIDLGWSCMVTGQSFVLWSRLHLVCRKQLVLRAVLIMIITDGILCHGTQWVCSLMAVQGGVMNPNFPPFKYAEKVTLCTFFAQEVIISTIYMWEAMKVLRSTALVKERGGKYRRMRNLFLANIVILILDVCLLSMEFAALWGVWCTFKGFAYSVKVKIEFVILKQLRSSVANPNGNSSHNGYSSGQNRISASNGLRIKSSDDKGSIPLSILGSQAKAFTSPACGPGNSTLSSDRGQITRTTEYTVYREDQPDDGIPGKKIRRRSDSPSSSEIKFATKGA